MGCVGEIKGQRNMNEKGGGVERGGGRKKEKVQKLLVTLVL